MMLSFAVGFKGTNQKADVLQTVALLKSVSPKDGGFLGLPRQPELTPAESGICTGKEDDFLVGVIRRFQSQWEAQVGQEYRLTKGTLFPKSMTMNQLVFLSNLASNTSGKQDHSVPLDKLAVAPAGLAKPEPASKSMDRWFGLCTKGGSILGIGGVEYLSGTLLNAGRPSEFHEFQMLSGRLGLGLGGSAGLVVCLIFNCNNLKDMEVDTQSDWGVNFAIGEKWDTTLKALKQYKFFATIAKVGKNVIKMNPDDIGNIRNAMSYLFTAYDMTKMSGRKMVTIDIPFAGAGVEVSAFFTKGKIEMLT